MAALGTGAIQRLQQVAPLKPHASIAPRPVLGLDVRSVPHIRMTMKCNEFEGAWMSCDATTGRSEPLLWKTRCDPTSLNRA